MRTAYRPRHYGSDQQAARPMHRNSIELLRDYARGALLAEFAEGTATAQRRFFQSLHVAGVRRQDHHRMTLRASQMKLADEP